MMILKIKWGGCPNAENEIICTIGPSCENEETLTQMCLAGMNVARLNFSHGSHEEHQKKIDLIKRVREKLELPIAIMLDTKGPEYRIKTFKDKKITLQDGDMFTFTTEDVVGDQTRVSVTYQGLIDDLKVGDTIMVNNGTGDFPRGAAGGQQRPVPGGGRRRPVRSEKHEFSQPRPDPRFPQPAG